jgi:hypothetical protein
MIRRVVLRPSSDDSIIGTPQFGPLERKNFSLEKLFESKALSVPIQKTLGIIIMKKTVF